METSGKGIVLVVGNNSQVQSLFRSNGYVVLHDFPTAISKPDIVCFTGGEDINPSLYGEARITGTSFNIDRDARELEAFEKYKNLPKIGICRGAQLLTVLSGGSLFQDVDGHRGSHPMVDLLFSREDIITTSVHHQMMIPPKDAYVLAMAKKATQFRSGTDRKKPEYDPEVVWIPKTKSLCIQGHPEYGGYKSEGSPFKDYFFSLIEWAFD